MSSNLLDNIHANKDLNDIIDDLCDICLSDIQTCPVNEVIDRCPQNVAEKASYEFYNGCD